MFRLTQLFVLLSLASVAVSGCNGIAEVDELQYLKETDEVDYYVDQATSINWPHVEQEPTEEVSLSGSPRTLLELKHDELRNMTLAEVMRIGLENSRVIRSRGAFLSPGNSVLSNPDRVPSFYDPSIQETGVLFGGRGVEAALAAFDTQLSTQMIWSHDEQAQNNSLLAGVTSGTTSVRDQGEFVSELSKDFGYGGQISLSHSVDYSRTNADRTNVQFPSTYTGRLTAQYQHPLLAGAGAEFTQVAGPIGDSFRGLSGVTQGVIIARINNDITIAELESSLTNLVKDIEDQYWDLYLQYRLYDTLVTTRNSTLRTWRDAKRKLDIGGVRGFSVEDEAQARDGYFQAQARVQQTLSTIYKTEAALRRLIGLPVNDGEIIRPSDEPVTVKLEPDWVHSVAEGLTHRVELRKHKWSIKSLELQLSAAKNLVRPRLDFIGSYSVNGFGDELLDHNDGPFSSMYGNMTDGTHTGWSAGFILQVPLGLRSAQAQVTNIELRLAKARDVLAAQELEIAHELGQAFQQLAEKYVTAQTNFNRRRAAQDRADLVEKKYKAGTQTLDLYLRSLASLADAETAYFQAIVEYNQAITALQYRMGTLLPYNQVFMAEGEWDPEAYVDALRRAKARTHALDASGMKHAEPSEFVEFDAHWADGNDHENVLPVDGTKPAAATARPDLPPVVDENSLELPPPAPEVEPADQEGEPAPLPDPPAARKAPPSDDQPLPIIPPGRASARKAVAPGFVSPTSATESASIPTEPANTQPKSNSAKPALRPASLESVLLQERQRHPTPEPKWAQNRLPSLEDLTRRPPQEKASPRGWSATQQPSEQPSGQQPVSRSDETTQKSDQPADADSASDSPNNVSLRPLFHSPVKAQPGTVTRVRK
ncbi:MAG: TolC family protein [Planctomycetota bacterium]|jgi:outer membrane protein TolC